MTPDDLAPHHFVLSITPEAADRPWHARLLAADAPYERHFDNPFELMRHLAQLHPPPPALPGGLK